MSAGRTPREAGKEEQRGRWRKAQQFADVCELIESDATVDGQLSDAYVTLAVHSGIASADVICIGVLARYWANGSHDQAAALLETVDKGAANQLRRLLGLKTKAGYTHTPASSADVKAAATAHRSLLDAARKRL